MKSLVLFLTMTSAALAQSGTVPVAGTWTAAFEGRTFVRLELKDAGGKLAGALSIGAVEVDKQGAVRRVDAAPSALTPIFDVVRKGSTVTFSRKDVTDVDRFELRLLDAGRAELRFLLTEEDRREIEAEGVAVPRPIVLTRR